MPEGITFILVAVVVLAVIFDYINGFHDTANSIATSVSTQALRPHQAVLMSAAANFVGALAGTAVATFIATGIVETPPGHEGQVVVAAALIGAIIWNLVTWRMGIPSSSSHAIIGGMIGGTIAAVWLGGQTGGLNVNGIMSKVIFPLVVSPILGIGIGFLLMVLLFNLLRRGRPRLLNDSFRKLQIGSAGFMAFSHGSNDAQKTMGIITLALVAAGLQTGETIPLWVILMSATAISLGTTAGGWRIMKTMGQKVVKLDPIHGFAAETTAATIILTASHFGMPVSTTHVISSAIMGVGSSDRFSRVRWGVAGNIVIAWVLTIPLSAATAMGAWVVLNAVT
jgi:PiT family inorganic phosphate transporter